MALFKVDGLLLRDLLILADPLITNVLTDLPTFRVLIVYSLFIFHRIFWPGTPHTPTKLIPNTIS